MKKSKIIAILLVMVMLFAGCSNEKENSTGDEKSTLDFDAEDQSVIDVDDLVDSLDSAEGNPNRPVEDILAELEIPAQGFAVFNSLDDPDLFILEEYNGGEIEFYYQVAVGNTAEEFALGVMIDGILQDCKIERNGTVSDYNKLHTVTIDKGTAHIYKVTVKPNTGKAGDTVQLHALSIMNPDARIKSESEYYDFSTIYFALTGFASVRMNVDAVNLTEDVCKNYSQVNVNTYHPLIGELFSYKSEENNITACLIYNDFNSAVWHDDSTNWTDQSFLIKADRKSDCPIHITLGGIDYNTTQRISVYVNGKIMPVFDGKYYADVPVNAGKQTDVEIKLDTQNLDEWSNIRVTYYNLTENGAMGKDLTQSDIYTLKVSK